MGLPTSYQSSPEVVAPTAVPSSAIDLVLCRQFVKNGLCKLRLGNRRQFQGLCKCRGLARGSLSHPARQVELPPLPWSSVHSHCGQKESELFAPCQCLCVDASPHEFTMQSATSLDDARYSLTELLACQVAYMRPSCLHVIEWDLYKRSLNQRCEGRALSRCTRKQKQPFRRCPNGNYAWEACP